MPGIDPSVACHQLIVDPGVSAIAQPRRKQSPEKSEAAEKAVKDLLEANFIYEAKYNVGTKGVSQNHLFSFDDNKVLKIIN